MKRILIVDDEYLVRLGLKTIIDWAEHDFVIAGEAANGREALELFNRTGADVILTDIKMPVMDGLELTRAVKEKNKKVKIIILSHYDEFAYAQEAINLGAFRYILKSELTKINLLNILKSLFYAVNEDAALPEDKPGTANLVTEREHYIENYLLPFFTDPKAAAPCPPLPEQKAEQEGKYVILCASCRLTTLLQDATQMFPKAVKILFAEAFDDSAVSAGYRYERFVLTGVLPFVENGALQENKITESCIRIIKNIRQYYDAGLFIGLSSTGTANDMARLFAEARTAVDLCFFSEKNFVEIFRSDLLRPQKAPSSISYSKLSAAIKAGQKDEAMEYIQNVFCELQELKNYVLVHNAFIDFLAIGKTIREQYHLDDITALSENKFDYATFFDLLFIGDVELYIRNIFLALSAGKQSGEITYSFIVNKCITFIQQNYTKNITLTDAAENAEVSHSYLSFIFKQETGINFNTWLSKFRVEEAKKLLMDTNMRIYQVAEKVGFSNPYYFSKVFKEFASQSCKEFRNESSGQE
jgi:two-component system response regulator YesN